MVRYSVKRDKDTFGWRWEKFELPLNTHTSLTDVVPIVNIVDEIDRAITAVYSIISYYSKTHGYGKW